MIKEFEPVIRELSDLLNEWKPRLRELTTDVITKRRNNQNRTIKQIAGHMIDSASNNTHRIVHLQYQESPLIYPNYATNGNNDRWIAIQNYQEEDWENIIELWYYSNKHVIHVIKHVNQDKLNNTWKCDEENRVSLKDMITDYLRHFRLHLDEMEELINQN